MADLRAITGTWASIFRASSSETQGLAWPAARQSQSSVIACYSRSLRHFTNSLSGGEDIQTRATRLSQAMVTKAAVIILLHRSARTERQLSSKSSGCSMNDQRHQSATAAAPDGSLDDVVLPHLDAAYRLASWLMRNEHDAEDVVQEASLRPLRYFRTSSGRNGRASFLRIVRNTCYGWCGHSFQARTDPLDEEQHSSARPAPDPETLLLQTDDVILIKRAMSDLADHFRELLVLRELESLSYRELADGMGVPLGTAMSGLSSARRAFRGALDRQLKRSGVPTGTYPRARRIISIGEYSRVSGV